MALFEFWSLNGKTSFELNFECRSIKMNVHNTQIVHNPYELSFYYLVTMWTLSVGSSNHEPTNCEERGFEEFASEYGYCITSFQGWSSI